MLPQPYTSLEIDAVCRQPPAHDPELHEGPVPAPFAQTPHPVVDCRVAKNNGGSPVAVTPTQPVEDRAATSLPVLHTCQPTPHRSETLHPVPSGFVPSSPAPRLHAGVVVLNVGMPHEGAMPGFDP